MAEYVDLGPVLRGISQLDNNVRVISDQVQTVERHVALVQNDVSTLDGRLATLQQEFRNYIKRYDLATELQLAETQIIKVRQELETSYGHYGDVRRRTTGILQATDVGIVQQDTITTVTEELMLAAPRYWLAPCLVAVARWLMDDKTVAEKALAESLNRDPNKTALFFALVGRRLGRAGMCGAWLERYFSTLNPMELDRDTVVLLDGLATGVFGIESRAMCVRSLQGWIELLGNQPGFLERQREQWRAALLQQKRPPPSGEFTYLPRYSPTWDSLLAALDKASVHGVTADHFRSIFEGPIAPSANLVIAADDLLDKLVSRFDDEELPLRQKEQILQIIIDEGGDKERATERAALAVDVLAEKVSFTQLLRMRPCTRRPPGLRAPLNGTRSRFPGIGLPTLTPMSRRRFANKCRLGSN